MVKKFIQKAIKHPGELTRYAEHEGCINMDGTIKDRCVAEHLSRMPESKQKQHLKRAYNFYHKVLLPAGTASMERTK